MKNTFFLIKKKKEHRIRHLKGFKGLNISHLNLLPSMTLSLFLLPVKQVTATLDIPCPHAKADLCTRVSQLL